MSGRVERGPGDFSQFFGNFTIRDFLSINPDPEGPVRVFWMKGFLKRDGLADLRNFPFTISREAE
jgi:hypothetical protein